ncbi:MAG: TlpA family protein disulfide reductase [Saprospiraceae bacterium]|nr:TlpA family protein disulfide reductase [Saprospiraceae bacterium]
MKKTVVSILVPLLAVALYLGGRHLYFKPKFINGDPAPNFSGVLPDGSAFELANLREHYVLLDFWASWCGPCRQENPAMVGLYKEFEHSNFRDAKGFEIVSIGVEKKAEPWKHAIEKDGLYWPYQLLDVAESTQFIDSPIAKQFQVREVPTKFLLNPSGLIIAVNPSPEDIRKLLLERLGK